MQTRLKAGDGVFDAAVCPVEVRLLGTLSSMVHDVDTQIVVLQRLIRTWSHADSDVRQAAILAVEDMCKDGAPGSRSLLTGDGDEAGANQSLQQHIVERLNDERCMNMDKRLLNRLLSWCYENQGT